MAQVLKTYKDIQDAVMEALGVQASDTRALNKIKRLINMVYLDEVVPLKRWRWLEKSTTVVHEAYYATGTVSVTHDSTTVTLSVAPNATVGSFKGYKFSVNGSQEVYTVASHTAESTTVTLSGAYIGTTASAKSFKLWRDRVDLPVDAKETVEVTHAKHTVPVKPRGWQEFTKLVTANPLAEGYPSSYSTRDFYDPTPLTGETEADRYRQMQVYPAITLNPVTLNIDYVVEPTGLAADTDEPVLPIGDRIVLYYGALSHAWGIIARDIESQQIAQGQYQAKLARMAGEIEDGFDQPTVGARSGYLSAFRNRALSRRKAGYGMLGGESSYRDPTYAKDIIIEGANLTANVTAEDGVLVDGVDISVLGASVDGFISGETVTITDNTANFIAKTWAVADVDVVHLNYSLKRGTNYEAGQLKIVTNGTQVAISDGAIAALNDAGITFDADINGSNLRLLATSTSTGLDCSMTFSTVTWKMA